VTTTHLQATTPTWHACEVYGGQ